MSTRKVDDLVKALGCSGIDKSTVSRICKELDEEAEAFRTRPLEGAVPYVWLDAVYEKVREGGKDVGGDKIRFIRSRIREASTSEGPGGGGRYDMAHVIATYDGSNNWLQNFVFSDDVDAVQVREQKDVLDYDSDGNTTEITRSFYHRNALGSVMEITDLNQAAVVSYRYDPYGNVTITRGGQTQSSDPLGSHWHFTGRYFDEESELYYYRARYYDPETGRFLQRDPLGYSPGPNLFLYVDSSPPNRRDASGQGIFTVLAIFAVVVAIVYLVKEALSPRAPRPRSPRPECDEPKPPDDPGDAPGPDTSTDTGTEDEDDESDGKDSQDDAEDPPPDPYGAFPGPLEDEIEVQWGEFYGRSNPIFFSSGNSKQRWRRQLRKEMLDNRWRPGDASRIPGITPGSWQPKKK